MISSSRFILHFPIVLLFRANGALFLSPGQRPDRYTHFMIAGPTFWSRQRPRDGSRGFQPTGGIIRMRLRRGATLETGGSDPGPPRQASRRDAIPSRPLNRGLKPTAPSQSRSATEKDQPTIHIMRGIAPREMFIRTRALPWAEGCWPVGPWVDRFHPSNPSGSFMSMFPFIIMAGLYNRSPARRARGRNGWCCG